MLTGSDQGRNAVLRPDVRRMRRGVVEPDVQDVLGDPSILELLSSSIREDHEIPLASRSKFVTYRAWTGQLRRTSSPIDRPFPVARNATVPPWLCVTRSS